ncbi:hypothetical protein BP6252_06700 [Coleophoma cylindrospora]|uniref:ubiquitinyl hydrolase 1 n=1 Tax=Coleophoma cylindrospora TaxID=1849047 RepID=A0A3D8RFG5_9HELO|nr:hypothetical protein BP6252_06700 [Coleophoma cylindrospora]
MTQSRNDTTVQRSLIIYPDLDTVLYMIHHVFLPPKLPQKDDFAPWLDSALADMVLDSLQEFSNLQNQNYATGSVASMARNFRAVHNESGHISQARLKETLAALSTDESKVVALHVSAQNAGVIVRRDLDVVVFEVFELSPDNKSIVSTKGRLQRSFPAFAVSVPLKEFSDEGFQTTLSQAISKMSAERIDEMQPKVKKAGEKQSETRDTVIPHLVTEHLVSFLRAVGEPISTAAIRKNTREEVMWKDAKSPWRRSPMWLLLRVAMQLTFSRLSADPLKSLYKPFMIFLMSCIQKLALTYSSIESDFIYAMNAKLSQRLLKVRDSREEPWFSSVRNTMIGAQCHINSRWESVMAKSCPILDLSALREIEPSENVVHELPHLDELLYQLQRLSTSKIHSSFKPRGNFPSFDPNLLPRVDLLALNSLDQSFSLTAFETWVELHLEGWLNRHINMENTCVALKDLIKAYHHEARAMYVGNPEALSLMVLTVMDLWVACDKAACRLYRSLKQYDHGIAPSLLWSLLLPLKSQLNRVSNVESYLHSRATQINKKFVSPFREFGHWSSFAVQYFEQSPLHQQLLTSIEEKAHQQKADKVQELAKLNQAHRELMNRHESACCEYVQVTEYDIDGSPYEKTQHSSHCQKCALLRQATSMTISLHEWPVSKESNKAKATIFELTVPLDFGAWRDVTHYMLQTVLGYKYESEIGIGSDYILQNDPGIKYFYQANIERVGIRSHTKPSTLTHRNPVSIPTTQASVCLANGLSYEYFDFNAGSLISPFATTSELHAQCTFVLPTRSKALQKFLQRPPNEPNGPEPNEVIASLSECPDGMSLDEFRSFALLPLGYEIQWQNILSQLAIPSLDFAKVDTTFLLLQISQQIGPTNNSASRASHEVLSNEYFSAALLEQLREAKRRVGENWESFQALAAFICLAARLLASTPFLNIQSGCLEYLASCRSLLFGWVTKLRAKVQSCTDDAQRAEFAARAVEIALICMSSFGIDRERLHSILCLTAEASVFLQCSITIQEHLLSIDPSRSSSAAIFLARWRQLMYKSYPELVHMIVDLLDPCLNLAIKEFWVDYMPCSEWQQLPEPNQCWLQSSSFSDGRSNSFSVHFNLLTAELLVNGAPLAKLPAQYENHAIYPTFFGRSHIQVMPSSQPGFQFSSRCEYAGYLIHFGFFNNDMLLRAVNDDCTYSLVPPRVLSGYLPQAFVQDYVHWFDHQLQAVCFVPIKDPWSQNPRYWRLSNNGDGWILTKGDETLVNLQSRTAQVFANILSSLEHSLFVHTYYHSGSRKVYLELPRLRLGFFFKMGNDTIWSRQFQDMSIDRSQNVGTLFGLSSKLVLTSSDGSRRVLIPEGRILYQRDSGHVSISVQRGVSRVHSYCVDEELGRFVGSGSMQSMLLLCYLHSLTSYCLPDPLTRVTGTEQALTIITSAATRSFDLLDRDNLDTLELIAQLAPKRLFYPKNLQDMQTIHWDPELSFLSQHGQLYLEVRDIFFQAARSKPLHPHFVDPPSLDWTRSHLLERDLIRSSTFRVSGFGAENYTNKHDICYRCRDHGQRSDRSERAFVVARSIFNKEPILHNQSLIHLHGYLWKELSVQEPIPGPQTVLTQTETLYGGHLLGETAQYLASQWCSAHISLSRSDCENRYRLMMWLSTIAFAQKADMLLIETFIAFYCIPAIGRIAPPVHRVVNVKEGDHVRNLAASIKYHPIDVCPEARLAPLARESVADTRTRRKRVHQRQQKVTKTSFIRMLEAQWPCEHPTRPSGHDFDVYIKVDATMAKIAVTWTVWWQNFQFHNYLNDIESELKVQSYRILDTSLTDFQHCEIPGRNGKRYIRNQDVFNLPPPQIPDCFVDNLAWLVQSSREQEHPSARVECLLEALESRVSASHEQQYLSDLRDSIAHLNRDSQTHVLAFSDLENIDRLLQYHRDVCRQQVRDLLGGLIQGSSQGFELAASVLHAPRTSQRFYLQQLSHSRWQSLSDEWRRYLVRYAKAFRAMQRAERLTRTTINSIEFIGELINVGDRNWDPMTFPEWLLLEVESGLLMREVQASIAKHMLSPEAGRNSVMQLNMGEGKSTLIVPAVAATLANGQNFVRVFVARPQSKQMFQMLVSKLGGFLGCRIYHMPISRSLQLGVSEAESLWAMYAECMRSGGILLVQPEHVLSFKLMAIESILNDDGLFSQSLLKSLHFFDTKSRDIIDESDENFSVKFELIYTMGLQQPVELSPDRWILIQHILGLVSRFAPKVAITMGTQSIEVDGRSGRFPRIRILQPEAGSRLRMIIAEHICESGLVGFPITHQCTEMRQAILRYITEPNLNSEEIAKVEDRNSTAWSSSSQGPLLLIRGLLASGVLDFVLGSKRWRVNYGINPRRLPPTKLAVPFRAKDCPSPRSEFSHPDVVIMLTSLSYYYGGLSDEDLFDNFQHLFRADQANVEYRIWTESAPELPEMFRHLSSINLKDRLQCVQEIFPALRFSKGAIDYFLSHHVFQKYIKEFPHKISASGWDLGQVKSKPTTGFSGTIDSRHLLPLDVHHLDLDRQKHTNALVLKHILQPENSIQVLPIRNASFQEKTQLSNASILLQTVKAMRPVVRVVLDVGAQILEFNNQQVVEKWLGMWEETQETEAAVFFNENDEISVLPIRNASFQEKTQLSNASILLQTVKAMRPVVRVVLDVGAQILEFNNQQVVEKWLGMWEETQETEAAVFFNENDEISVIDRKGQVELLQVSPYASRLDVCLVYLDEAHTRGTDLRLPTNYRAAVTLGPDLTKDRLVQACMRMRKLGKGQSLVFCIPDEIRAKILRLKGTVDGSLIGVSDVLRWCISETFVHHRRSMPLWAMQGRRFISQRKVWEAAHGNDCIVLSNEMAKQFLEDESQSLNHRYRPRTTRDMQFNKAMQDEDVAHILQRCREFNISSTESAALEEEQERELSPEIEEEREVEKPARAQALKHSLHKDLVSLVATGRIVKHSQAFLPAFKTLLDTTAAEYFNISQFPGDLLVTVDFSRTVRAMGGRYVSDSYLRPVQWILTCTNNSVGMILIIISPFEAQRLLPGVRKFKKVTLHNYLPRSSLQFRALDSLDLFTEGGSFNPSTIPQQISIQLKLFAGQLYLSTFEEYTAICDFLGLAWQPQEHGVEVTSDGFIIKNNSSSFTTSPVKFLYVFMTKIRRNCDSIEKTHMGRILNGTLLETTDFVA